MVTVSEALSRVRHLVRLKIDKIKFKVCKKDRMIKKIINASGNQFWPNTKMHTNSQLTMDQKMHLGRNTSFG